MRHPPRDPPVNRTAMLTTRPSRPSGRSSVGVEPHDLLHLARELGQREGLGQEMDVAVLAEALAEGLLGIAGDADHRHLGAGLAHVPDQRRPVHLGRSEEHTSELQSLMPISYAVFCYKKQNKK